MNTLDRKPGCQYAQTLPSNAVEIPGFPLYYATPDGAIFARHGRLKQRRFSRNSCGYPICSMRNTEGRLCFPMVHRIIAKLFVQGDTSLEVNHIDMNKENCRADNLEWVTKSNNHKKLHTLRPGLAQATAGRMQVALIATHPETWEQHRFESGKTAALWVGNANASGNISKACVHGREAYGFYWAKA